MYCFVQCMLILSKRLLKALASTCLFMLIFLKRILKYVNQMIIKDLDKVTFQESPQCPVNFLLIVWKIQVRTISNFSITCIQYLIYSSHLLVENLGMQNLVMNSSHVVLMPY